MSDFGDFSDLGYDFELYDWQKRALDLIDCNDGCIAAITGSGKSLVAMERMKKHLTDWTGLPIDCVPLITVVVPTKALMIQWHEELIAYGFPPEWIGRKGGGSIKGWKNASVQGGINITTFASLSKGRPDWIPLEEDITSGMESDIRHLVVVDECHNLRGKVMRKALSPEICPRDYTLGLSATPHPTEEARRTITELIGPVLMSYRYAEALADGVIPPFKLNLVQIPIEVDEDKEIEFMSKRIRRLMQDADYAPYEESNRLKAIARNLGSQRKRLINRVRGRNHMAIRVLNRYEDRPTLLFHDSTDDVDRLAQMTQHLNPSVYHSNTNTGDQALEAFKNGETDHLYSCLALTEGFNVPRVQVAIMMSGPNAPLRRIQTLGRCLRGKDTVNEIFFFYVNHKKDLEGVHNLIETADIPPQVIHHYKMNEEWMEEIAPLQTRVQYSTTGREGELQSIYDRAIHDDGLIDQDARDYRVSEEQYKLDYIHNHHMTAGDDPMGCWDCDWTGPVEEMDFNFQPPMCPGCTGLTTSNLHRHS